MSMKAASKNHTPADASPDANAAAALAREARIRAAAIEKATQLHSTAKAKAQWDEWISKVQGKLIEPGVTRSTLQRAAIMLRPSEYDEVIEERAASRLCANPPCSVQLELKPSEKQKKFHISLSQQRVYDVRQAQQFCGEECFMESEIYKRSLSDEPFYMRQLGGQSIAPQPEPTTQQKQQQQVLQPKTEEKKENPNADKNVITQLFIVEKEKNSVSTKFPAAASDSSTKSALAVEGYQPKTVTAASKDTEAKEEEKPTQSSTAASTTSSTSSNAVDSSEAKPVIATASDAAPAPATSASAPAAVPASSTTTTTASASTPLHSMSSINSPLPTFDASKPLTRSAIDSLSPEQRSEYLSQMAQHVHHADADQSNGVAVMVTAATPQSEEKKIRRRKAPGSADHPKPTTHANSSTSSTSTTSTTRTNMHSPAAVAAAVSAAPVSSLLASEEDDPDDPIISPQEIKSSLSSVRNHSLPSFVAVLQCFMRWTTLHTGTYLRTGRTPAPPQPAASNRQRQTAFLTMLKQHWTPVTNRLAVSRNFVHELKELTDTFSFDDSIPALRAEQWHAISLILLKSVTLRVAIQEGEISRDSFTMNSWDWIKYYSNLRTAGTATPTSPAVSPMHAAVEATAKTIGFSMDQLNSVFEQWMMQSEQSYAVSSSTSK